LLEKSHGNIGSSEELHSPIDDFGVPADQENFFGDANMIISELKAGKKIFVHCHSGKGRTALALATVLVRLGFRGTEALTAIKSTLGPETEAQCQFVLNINKYKSTTYRTSL
jgi:protein-tyrosine phosphatase